MTSWSLFTLSGWVRGHTCFCVPCWSVLVYRSVFPSLTFTSWTFCFLGLCWDTVHMSVSLPPDKLADIHQLALSLLQTPHVTVHGVMSFLGKANFCTNGHSQTAMLMPCHSEWHAVCLSFSTQLFLHVYFSLSSLHQLEWLAHLHRAQFLYNFYFLMWLLLLMPPPLIGPFIFRDLVAFMVSGSWLGSLCRAHIALQGLQAVAIMLHRMAFCLW